MAVLRELACAARRSEPTGQGWRHNSLENSSILEYTRILFSVKREDKAPAGRYIGSSQCGMLEPRQGSCLFAFTPFCIVFSPCHVRPHFICSTVFTGHLQPTHPGKPDCPHRAYMPIGRDWKHTVSVASDNFKENKCYQDRNAG